MKILIVEDEKHLAEALLQILKKNNYNVDVRHNGKDGLYECLTGVYDLIILDIMLPELDGLSILKKIRNEKLKTPVILLTAKGQLSDKVLGLDCGADDYLSKPFDIEELLARVRALLRRQGEIIFEDTISFGDISLNLSTLKLVCNDVEVKLTNKESELLELLILRKNILTSKELIIEKLWGYEGDYEHNNVEVYISFLRKKLKFIKAVTTIETVRGVGYNLFYRG